MYLSNNFPGKAVLFSRSTYFCLPNRNRFVQGGQFFVTKQVISKKLFVPCSPKRFYSNTTCLDWIFYLLGAHGCKHCYPCSFVYHYTNNPKVNLKIILLAIISLIPFYQQRKCRISDFHFLTIIIFFVKRIV